VLIKFKFINKNLDIEPKIKNELILKYT